MLSFISPPVCMIVEDDALIGIALEGDFTAAGYEVAGPFATCAAALAALHVRKPDVATLDTVLKDGPCLGLARELRRRSVPFMVYSGYDEAHQNAPELVGALWIDKPAQHSDLVYAAGELIAQAERLPRASRPIRPLLPFLTAHLRDRASEEPWW
jgi:DNA-binding response OmpR family regulator